MPQHSATPTLNSTLPSTTTFEYSPLQSPNEQIRLVHFRFANGKDGILECFLYTYDLRPAPPYVALSYAWGLETDASHEIRLQSYRSDPSYEQGWQQDNGSFWVKQNLYDFLCMAANHPLNQPGVLFWIDQISINQADLVEKSHALPMMPEIYENAYRVISWLGNDADFVDSASRFQASHSLEALTMLLKNRYFKRLWVVQEVLLARAVDVYCGRVALDFADMFRVYDLGRSTEEDNLSSLGLHSPLFLMWDFTYNRRGRSLAESIQRYSVQKCSNPRDKVYALQGLVNRYQRIGVSYQSSVYQVFLDAVDMLVKSESYLTLYSRHQTYPSQLSDAAETLATNMGLLKRQRKSPNWPRGWSDIQKHALSVLLDEFKDLDRGAMPNWLQKAHQIESPSPPHRTRSKYSSS